jgi:hypothetical protein
MHQLEGEGIVKTSGIVRGSVRKRDYRRPGEYVGAGISSWRGTVVLSKQHLAIDAVLIPVAELRRYQARVVDDRLSIASDEPLNATGHIEFRVAVTDAPAWVQALRDAGAGK